MQWIVSLLVVFCFACFWFVFVFCFVFCLFFVLYDYTVVVLYPDWLFIR